MVCGGMATNRNVMDETRSCDIDKEGSALAVSPVANRQFKELIGNNHGSSREIKYNNGDTALSTRQSWRMIH